MMLDHKFVCIPITSDIEEEAFARVGDRMHLHNSRTGRQGRMRGALLEVCGIRWLRSERVYFIDRDTRDHDIFIPGFGSIDFKATTCRSVPKLGFEVSLSIEHNGVIYYSQDTTAYCWGRLQTYEGAPNEERFKCAWIVGWEYKHAFLRNSELRLPDSPLWGKTIAHTARFMHIFRLGSPELLLYLVLPEVQNAEELLERVS